MERHAELPAALYAHTVTVLFPTSRGIDADHDVVPVAVPWPPVDVVHWTDVVLLLAVPLTVMAAMDTETIEDPGEEIAMLGGPALALVPLPVLLGALGPLV